MLYVSVFTSVADGLTLGYNRHGSCWGVTSSDIDHVYLYICCIKLWIQINFKSLEGARGVMFTVVGNRHGDSSLNPE